MAAKKKIVNIGNLKVGMKLAEEIRVNNILILPADVLITENILNKLRKTYFHNSFTVYDVNDETDEEIIGNLFNLSEDITLKEIKRNFIAISQDLEKAFDRMTSTSKIDINEVKDFAYKVNKHLELPSAVIKNIVLYGSGEDSIYKHSVNVAALSSMLGKWIGLEEKDINLLTYAAILHDIGKTKIPKNILNKVSALSLVEKKAIQVHSKIGYNFVKDIPFIDKSVSYSILMHHERMDGSGYPLGVTGDKIHPFAKIIAIADVFDAVNSNRIHKKRKDPFRALDTVQKNSILKLDYEYCKIFVDHIINYYIGEKIQLNNGKVCNILQIDKNNLSKPFIMDDHGFLDLNIHKNLHIENLVV